MLKLIYHTEFCTCEGPLIDFFLSYIRDRVRGPITNNSLYERGCRLCAGGHAVVKFKLRFEENVRKMS